MQNLPEPQRRSRLADHVRACRVGDQVILLDLLRNKYIGVSGPQMPVLCASIAGWPAPGSNIPTPPESGAADDWLHRLHQERLLADVEGPVQELPRLPEARASLNAEDCDCRSSFEWQHLFRLWRAAMVSSIWLRGSNLFNIANRLAVSRTPSSKQIPRGDCMSDAAAQYMWLRPFALTSYDRCLNDSLALVLFLAAQGLYPRWVIGVRTHPFGAHSWVQDGAVVLNDQHERVRRYEPILVV